MLNGVCQDLSPHPVVSWAVVIDGQLLPIRFATEKEAVLHLGSMTVIALGKEPVRAPLTGRQRQYLDAVRALIDTNGKPPTYRELAGVMKVDVHTAHGAVQGLAERGLVERTPIEARGGVPVSA